MKLRYLLLLPELILLFFFLAPIYKRICNPGNLGGALCCLFLMALTIFPKPIAHFFRQLWTHLPGKIGLIIVGACVAFGIVFCSVMSVQMVRAMEHTPQTPETVIVLGCKVRGTTPSAMLTRRLEAALAYLNEHEDVMCITTGGQGAGEDIPEGEAMKTWLVAHGIAESRILVDNTSADTHENIQNAAAILKEQGLGNEVVIITDGFHQYRASLMAKDAGLYATAYSARTNPLYVPTYWVREWMALFELVILDHA